MDYDPEIMTCIIENLISNAIKYSDPDKKVIIHLSRNNKNHLEIKVKDQGRGISEVDLPRIYDKFYRVGNDDSIPGNGLGLALVKSYIKNLEGNIHVKSKLDHGSTFMVSLPVTTESTRLVHDYQNTDSTSQATSVSTVSNLTTQEGRKNILVVEDSNDVSYFLGQCLESYNVLFAANGEEGFSMAKSLVPDLITAGSPKVAIRIPEHPLSLELLSRLEYPLAAPSANPFGYISPTEPAHVEKQLGLQIDYILDGGKCEVGLESTIVEWRDDELWVLRKGAIAIEDLGQDVRVAIHSTSNPKAPGMLKSHYAPRIPVMISPGVDDLNDYNLERVGALRFDKVKNTIPLQNQLILSKEGSLDEAARNLFSYLRALDEMDIDLIIVDLVPDEGIGRAINDKLKRAAT